MRSEVEDACGRIKSRKEAAGTDGIVAEMLRAAAAITVLHQICNGIWQTGKWPDDWTESIYVPIHKKGQKIYVKTRTIALINQASKVVLYILQKRLKSYLLPQIPPTS